MSVTVQQILGLLQTLAPSELACSWDNVGLLVDVGVPVSHVLTTLDITAAVVQEAVENDCQRIVSHHPVIFDPLKHISAGDVPALLIKNNISAICMHTNLDAAPGGVNDTLADLLGMQREGRRNFAEDCGRIGPVEPTTVQQLARSARTRCTAACGTWIAAAPSPAWPKSAVRAAATCRKLLMRARIALSPARPPTTSLCWLNRKALAWWSPVIGAPSTASPMCWLPISPATSRPLPSATLPRTATPIPTYYKRRTHVS